MLSIAQALRGPSYDQARTCTLGAGYVLEPYHTRTAMYCSSIRTYIGCEVLYAESWSECTCVHVVK